MYINIFKFIKNLSSWGAWIIQLHFFWNKEAGGHHLSPPPPSINTWPSLGTSVAPTFTTWLTYTKPCISPTPMDFSESALSSHIFLSPSTAGHLPQKTTKNLASNTSTGPCVLWCPSVGRGSGGNRPYERPGCMLLKLHLIRMLCRYAQASLVSVMATAGLLSQAEQHAPC